MIDVFVHQLTQYYGTDWLAMVSTFMYLYLIGNKQRSAFIYAFFASLCWLIFGWLNQSFASVFANIIFIILNIRGYIKWAPQTN